MDIWLKILIAFAAIQNVLSLSRLVVNTTCLELAKSSNQQFRLSCSQNDYHCLLDETFTREFEVCREWKWIPGGKCAYFNTYGSGNVDERECKPRINLICSESKRQFESTKNTQFTACYAKKPISNFLPTLPTSLSPTQATPDGTSDGDTAISSSTKDRQQTMFIIAVALTLFFGVTCPILSISVIISIYKCSKFKSRQTASEEETIESTDEKTSERTSLLNKNEETSVNQKQRSLVQLDVATDKKEPNEVVYGTEEYSKEKTNQKDDKIPQEVGEKSAGGTSNRCSDSVQLDVTTDKEEPNELFNDTVKKLKEKTNQTDEKNIKLLNELYDLLNEEGLKLSQEVMAAIILKETGKTINDELANKEVQCKVEEILRDGLKHLTNEKDRENSINVSYALLRIILGEKDHPKSGWGNPIWKKDVGIGDDVERLNRIQTIASETSNPADISEEDYFRLLDIMLEALARLNHDKYRALADKMKSIKNPSLIQTLSKKTIEMYKSLTYSEK